MNEAVDAAEGVALDPHMSRKFSEEHVLHVRDEVLPAAVEREDVKVVRACEELLTAHGHAIPNSISGSWEPLSVPRSEMQVRELFAHKMPEFGYEIIRSGEEFPDWLLRDVNGRYVYAEVEHRSMGFYSHGHDPRWCDLIVCWEHDDLDASLPVLELLSGNTFEPKEQAEPGDRSQLMVNWAGQRASLMPPIRKRNRRKLVNGDKAYEKRRVVHDRYVALRPQVPRSIDAANIVAEEYGIAAGTVLSYVSRARKAS